MRPAYKTSPGRITRHPPPTAIFFPCMVRCGVAAVSGLGGTHWRRYPTFQPNYFVTVVDGVHVEHGFANASFSTATVSNTSATEVVVAANLDPNQQHDIRIFKSSECQWASLNPRGNRESARVVLIDCLAPLRSDLSAGLPAAFAFC